MGNLIYKIGSSVSHLVSLPYNVITMGARPTLNEMSFHSIFASQATRKCEKELGMNGLTGH